jgi:hypothetical protein
MSQSTGTEAPSAQVTRRALIRTLAAGAVAQTLRAEASPHSPSTSFRSPTMSKIDRRLAELGITLPKPWTISIPPEPICEPGARAGQERFRVRTRAY